eukprot:gene20837-32132_t
MRVAFILFDGITYLDFLGVYDSVTRLRSMDFLPDLQWTLCGFSTEIGLKEKTVTDSFGMRVVVECMAPEDSLGGFDAVVVPGGFGTRELVKDAAFIKWLKTCEPCKHKISVCTGSLLLGEAGLLRGKRATTNANEFEALQPHCGAAVPNSRVVEDGDCITAGGVASSLDLGIYLCQKWAGPAAAAAIKKRMEYPYGPYGNGAQARVSTSDGRSHLDSRPLVQEDYFQEIMKVTEAKKPAPNNGVAPAASVIQRKSGVASRPAPAGSAPPATLPAVSVVNPLLAAQ